ncbi:MAG TPA: hypothetical protein VK707_07245 [Solirubrobacteraceae bacterium]|nr:hypothetical protein [Solirubrobacteraceae bacterium]
MTNERSTSRNAGHAPEAIALDASPASVLHSFAGEIVDATIAHPSVLHVEVRDPHGGRWRLASQNAQCSPSTPSQLVGRSVQSAQIDTASGALRCALSDGATLQVEPTAEPGVDQLPTWELISPAGLALEFGPGSRWRIESAGTTGGDSAQQRR